ncbi:RICIN domain-containing protein [Pontibacter sp. G13]|uniref:RICIN domain-containing protein n=1 Tax=Pontibacter sp. G13 TaxID=3074898 RepID=UPI00288C1662|nr:RICIN domain-containing protein [Pontibacter sp. G13]WNJ17338.1 RICIN domain-containing protein [Pontibacter sp. G13]
MKKLLRFSLWIPMIMTLLGGPVVLGQSNPTFNSGQDPKPSGKVWALVGNLSDEFSGTSLNTTKWKNTDPTRWVGRAPGLFKQNTVSVANGNMRITNYKLGSPEVVNGSTFTHACGHVISQNTGNVGYYYEARMKANKTFMSSTFWLINYKNEQTGCDQRVTELDIQECVGYINSTASWTQDFDQSMHSNTHSRNVSCGEPVGSRGDDTPTGGKVYDAYHTYGAWWKSATEIQFFLDGQYVYSVTPYADFDIPMYIKLVTETYDWNPVPADGGMTGTWTERTTFYDWVRTWKLEDAPSGQLIANGRYAIKNKADNKYLGAPEWPAVGNNFNAITVTPGAYNDQRWDFEHLGNDVYRIKLACCTRYLEVPYANCANGSNVGTWTAATASHQKWKLEKVGNYYMFKPTHCTSRAMDRSPNSGSASTYNNDNVHLWNASSTNDNQLWEIIPNASARLGETTQAARADLVVAPQPVSGTDLNVTFDMLAEGTADLVLFDLKGQTIYQRHYPKLQAGQVQLRVPATETSKLAAGMYIMRVTGNDGIPQVAKVWVK